MDFMQIIGVSAGCVLGLGGLWMMRGAKRVIGSSDGPAGGGEAEGGISVPTRLTLGLAGLIVGYHLVMWCVPALSYGVPIDRWWIVVGGAALAVVGAWAVDLVESGRGM